MYKSQCEYVYKLKTTRTILTKNNNDNISTDTKCKR